MEKFTLPHDHGNGKAAEKMRQTLLRTEQFDTAAEVFRQLSDATRVRIFWLLCHQESCVANLSAMLNMSSPAVSHHLRSLSDCGLLVSRRDGKEVHYRAADSPLCRQLHVMVEQVLEIACPEKSVDHETSPAEVVHLVHEYLVEHLGERITIEALSRHFLINPTTLKQAFKKEYGDTLAAHMREHRMHRAAQLLDSTGESVASVARQVGYESQSRFTSAFKAVFGILPTEYRKQHGADTCQKPKHCL